MTDLIAITALGAETALDQRFGALHIVENDGLALASLTQRRGAAAPMPLGLALPGPGKWVSTPGIGAFWTGPDQWMIEAPGRAHEDFAATLMREAPGCAITEQTDGWVCFEIASQTGPAPIRALLEKLVNLDAAGFTPGSATRTGLHHMSTFLIRRAEDRLAVIGMRSLAGSLWHALAETATRLARTERPD